ncbi:MAG TPA: tetratricopeptide repeat protein [Kofleriaceae bacterium]|nr:tetratricopeptide repeat protein [Kofleriaceae bacterium]
MKRSIVVVLAFACRRDVVITHGDLPAARIPSASGAFAPSLVAITGTRDADTGTTLADVDSCASCHPDAAAQWSSSAHSFASFGNPIYRYDVELVRGSLGKAASQHCGGCHDLPLLVDNMMTSAEPIPAGDLRAHSGVTCRLCHGVARTTFDGNASYVWNATPPDAPVLGDAASIARHKQQVTTTIDSSLCIGCHRGFLPRELGLPSHLGGVDETGAWQSSAWTGNDIALLDRVEPKTCIDCHMERVPASPGELGAKHGTIASHRFVGGHTWMASMRGDAEQLALTQAKLEGAASIDVAGPSARAGARLEFDVVIRNLLVGHRFPGGLLDVQDTWVEVAVADRRGRRLADSGFAHATDADDRDAHVLRTLIVDADGELLDEHQLTKFRAQIATRTLAPRAAQAIRYGFVVPSDAALPLSVTARLRHRSRTLHMQAEACRAAQTPEGRAFIAGARGARGVELDPCKPQPITLVAEAHVVLGERAADWQRLYDHGMALAATIVTRLPEARAVLELAHERAPDPRARAMVAVQLGWVAARQGRIADVLAYAREAREQSDAPAIDAFVADAYVRANRWADAIAPAKSCTERAPKNAAAWALYARVLVAIGDHRSALAAATRGLELAPRDADLLRSQATALAALHDPRAEAAQAAYVTYRAPDDAAGLRIRCAQRSATCARDRNAVETIELRLE